MNILCKNARDWLIQSSRRSFYEVLEEAKITPRQMQIAEMRYVKGMMNFQIAMELNISTKTVDKDINKAHKAVDRVLRKMV